MSAIYICPKSIVLEWLSPCFKSSVAQEGHFCSSSQLVHAYIVLVVSETLAHSFLQINDNDWQSDLNHYCVMFFVQRSRTIFNSVMMMIKTKVMSWLGHTEFMNSWNLFITGTR